MSQQRDPLQIGLVLVEIFGHLPLYDLLLVRGVCKSWRLTVQDFIRKRQKELVLFYKLVPRPLLWQHDLQSVNLNNSLIVNATFKQSEHFKETFGSIISLFIATYEDIFLNKDLNYFLHSFGQLENLEIRHLNQVVESSVSYEVQLNLPNLQTLFFSSFSKDRVIRLNCPKLLKLSIIDNFELNADFFTSINLKFLKVRSFAYHRLFRLLNLETLMFCKSIQINLADFPSLKRIHLFGHKKAAFNDAERQQTLNGLLEQRRNLRRDDLEIFYEGVRCGSEHTVREAIDSCKSQFGSLFFYRNYDFYRDNSDCFDFRWISKILKYSDDFNEELHSLSPAHTGQISTCIQQLYFGKSLKNRIKFENWSNMFSHVSSVVVRQLPQDQLDELPNQLPYLVEFSFLASQQRSVPVNFGFVSRFQALKCFNIDRGLVSFDEFKSFLNACRFFYYAILHPSLHVILLPSNRYYLRTTKYKEKFEFPSKQRLFDFLDQKNLIVKNC